MYRIDKWEYVNIIIGKQTPRYGVSLWYNRSRGVARSETGFEVY